MERVTDRQTQDFAGVSAEPLNRRVFLAHVSLRFGLEFCFQGLWAAVSGDVARLNFDSPKRGNVLGKTRARGKAKRPSAD